MFASPIARLIQQLAKLPGVGEKTAQRFALYLATADESVAAAQREMTGQPDYLQLLRDQGLLRPELSVENAGHLLNCVIQGFFAGAEAADPPPLADQATLLAFVLSRSLAAEEPPTPGQVAALGASVIELFTAITDVQRRQLQQAY